MLDAYIITKITQNQGTIQDTSTKPHVQQYATFTNKYDISVFAHI